MGWTFAWRTKKEIVQHLTESLGRNNDVLTVKVVHRVYYAAIRPKDGSPGVIFVALLRKDNGYGWGYKDMDETMGPVESSCPIGLLDLVPCPDNEYARRWRERVRQSA
jgi:hypothetical protein